MWIVNLFRLTRFDEGEVPVYHVSGVPDIFTHVGESYTNASDEADYYGILTDIIQIEYEGAVDLKITLFKCKWYDPKIGRGTRRSNGGIVDILSSRKYYKYDPFILGEYEDKESTLLQQDNDDVVLMTTIEDLAVDHLSHVRRESINLDIDVEDEESEDEFQCKKSSSDDDDDGEDGKTLY
ncbi:hypothetical protein Bca4012_089262 [Brassica carinata]